MSHLVVMTKNGETLGVHPDLVGAHEHLGWTVGGELPVADALRDDGPTVAEYVAAGYQATNYPPRGFTSRSTPKEIAEAIAAQAGDGIHAEEMEPGDERDFGTLTAGLIAEGYVASGAVEAIQPVTRAKGKA
jgi:hypothetical protein